MGVKGSGRTVATSVEMMSTLYTQASRFLDDNGERVTKLRGILNNLQSENADNLRGGEGEAILENLNLLQRLCTQVQGDMDAIKFSINKKLSKTQEMLKQSSATTDAAAALAASRNKAKK